jgi:hypothetical protein
MVRRRLNLVGALVLLEIAKDDFPHEFFCCHATVGSDFNQAGCLARLQADIHQIRIEASSETSKKLVRPPESTNEPAHMETRIILAYPHVDGVAS